MGGNQEESSDDKALRIKWKNQNGVLKTGMAHPSAYMPVRNRARQVGAGSDGKARCKGRTVRVVLGKERADKLDARENVRTGSEAGGGCFFLKKGVSGAKVPCC